jgi:hypothetical protein
MFNIRESIGFTPKILKKGFCLKHADNTLSHAAARRRRKQKVLTESLNFGSRAHLGQLSVLHTRNFEIQVPKGSHLRKVFRGFVV